MTFGSARSSAASSRARGERDDPDQHPGGGEAQDELFHGSGSGRREWGDRLPDNDEWCEKT